MIEVLFRCDRCLDSTAKSETVPPDWKELALVFTAGCGPKEVHLCPRCVQRLVAWVSTGPRPGEK